MRHRRGRHPHPPHRLLGAAVVSAALLLAGCAPTPIPPDGAAWSDEFDGPAGSAPSGKFWTIQTGGGGWGNHELQTYTDDAVRLDGDGHLTITARISGEGSSTAYTSGRVTSQGKGSFEYGRLEARIRLPEGVGLLPAFWLLGDSLSTVGWPRCGEIDVVETPFGTSAAYSTLHMPSSDASGQYAPQHATKVSQPLSSDYHVYGLEKRAGHITITLDGVEVLSVDQSEMPASAQWVFEQPVHVLFSLAIGGDWPGKPDATTPRESTMSIDWVRLYDLPSPTPTPGGTGTPQALAEPARPLARARRGMNVRGRRPR